MPTQEKMVCSAAFFFNSSCLFDMIRDGDDRDISDAHARLPVKLIVNG